jgi:hypothetical protein
MVTRIVVPCAGAWERCPSRPLDDGWLWSSLCKLGRGTCRPSPRRSCPQGSIATAGNDRSPAAPRAVCVFHQGGARDDLFDLELDLLELNH